MAGGSLLSKVLAPRNSGDRARHVARKQRANNALPSLHRARHPTAYIHPAARTEKKWAPSAAMLPFPSTPKRPPRALLPFDSPFFAAPALAPYHSPTPVRDHHLVYPDLFSRRTLSAADSLLHLAASPAASPARLLYPSFESESSHSHGHSQSTQSTFPPSPLPSTPSRIIRASHPSAKVDVLDLSSHLFSSPSFRSPDRFALLDDPPLDSQSISVSPILRESDRALKAQQKDGDALPVVQTRTLPSLARFVATDDDTTNDTNSVSRGPFCPLYGGH